MKMFSVCGGSFRVSLETGGGSGDQVKTFHFCSLVRYRRMMLT